VPTRDAGSGGIGTHGAGIGARTLLEVIGIGSEIAGSPGLGVEHRLVGVLVLGIAQCKAGRLVAVRQLLDGPVPEQVLVDQLRASGHGPRVRLDLELNPRAGASALLSQTPLASLSKAMFTEEATGAEACIVPVPGSKYVWASCAKVSPSISSQPSRPSLAIGLPAASVKRA